MPIVTLSDIRAQGFTDPPYSDVRVNEAIAESEDYIEQVTGNWFDVRARTLILDGSGVDVLPIPHPIIDITSVSFYDEEIDLTDIAIANRHLQGYLDYDDRQDPKLEFRTDRLNALQTLWKSGNRFPQGNKNITVVGNFGYRDYDVGNVQGKVPPMMIRAVYMLIKRFLPDAASSDATAAWRAHELSKKTTRNQSCEMSSAITRGVLFGGLTGDLYLDRILSLFSRPIGVEVI